MSFKMTSEIEFKVWCDNCNWTEWVGTDENDELNKAELPGWILYRQSPHTNLFELFFCSRKCEDAYWDNYYEEEEKVKSTN